MYDDTDTPHKGRLRALDVAAISLSLLIVAGFSAFAYTGGDKNPSVFIEASGETWIYPLREDRQVVVPGPLGTELIQISGGQTWVVTSPCPNKICIQQGKISRPGQWIACLPNRIFIRISGQADDGFDSLSY